jgi:hypothetical protein
LVKIGSPTNKKKKKKKTPCHETDHQIKGQSPGKLYACASSWPE